MNWLQSTLLIILFLSFLLLFIMLYPLDRRELLKRKAKGVWRDLYFWLSLLFEDAVSVGFTIVACIAVVLFILSEKIPREVDSIILSLIVALVFPTFIGLIRRFAKYGETFEKVDNKTLWLTEKFIEFIRGAKVSSDRKSIVVKSFFDKYPEDYGGVIIGAEEKEYIEQLITLLPLTQRYFFATLRGGKEPVYSIKWFFTKIGMFGLEPKEKEKYLKAVNDANHIKERIRIMLFKDHELEDFCNDNMRNKFLELNKNGQLYSADPDKIQEYLIKEMIGGVTLAEKETSFIWEDYAIFDQEIAIKHNGQNSLYLGMAKQISKMILPFKLLKKKPDLFRGLNSNGIYLWDDNTKDWNILEYKWDDWKRKFFKTRDQERKIEHSVDKT